MRIKSYFAPSVQSAIGLARKEFGEDITLVTSHASSLEARHLGDYEVVFAIDDSSSAAPGNASLAAQSAPVPQPNPAFEDLLQDAISAKPSTQMNIPEKLEQIRTSFIELGIEPAMVRALMTILERSLPLCAVTLARQSESAPETAMPAETPTVTVPVIRDSMAALESLISEDVKLAFTAKPVLTSKAESILAASLRTPQPFSPPNANLSAAEMAFVMSVSGGGS